MTAPLCPACRHPTRKHDSIGCTVNAGTCFCEQTRATLADVLDPATVVEVIPTPEMVDSLRAKAEAYGSDALHAMADDLAAAIPDSPAGEDGEVSGVAPQPAQGDLPGTSPAPGNDGHEAAAAPPVSGQPAAEDGPPASAAGRIALGTTWLCRLDRLTATGPGGCARCGEPLDRYRIYAERATDG